MGAYAACAFSSLAPGATVIAWSPQSTLAPDIADWDRRYPAGRAADWTGAFADAAHEVRSAATVWLIHDPRLDPDARHAARFRGPNIHHLYARHARHGPAQALRQAGVLGQVTRDMVDGTMTPTRFYALYRATRRLRGYPHSVAEMAQASNRPDRMLRVARALRSAKRPKMAAQLEAAARQVGRTPA